MTNRWTIKAQNTAAPKVENVSKITAAEISLDSATADDFANSMDRLQEKQRPKSDCEVNARLTVARMMVECPNLDQNFSFKTFKFAGAAHVQSMRVVLSRARQELRAKGKTPREFKLLLVGITHENDHDLVTVVRTQRSSLKAKQLYDDIISALVEES